MISNINYKFLIAGFLLASVIAFGSLYVFTQNGSPTTVSFSDEDEVTIVGTLTSIDDHGFTMTTGSETFYVPIPYDVDRSVHNIAIGSEVTVVGYILDSPMMDSSSYTMILSIIINGITIDHNPQMQSRSGDCGGNGGMGGNGNMGGQGPYRGGMKGLGKFFFFFSSILFF